MNLRLTSGLGLLIAAAAGGVLLSSPVRASLPEEPLGSERAESSRERRVKGSHPIQLAAKKKKKKKASGKRPAAGAPAETESDETGSATGSGASSGGASDEDLQKAARVAPKDSGDDAASTSTSRKPTTKVDDDGASAHGLEGPTPRFLDVSIGGQGFLRSLSYNQYVQGDVREYQPKLLGGAVAAVEWYPGAHVTRGFLTNIGVDLNIAQAFGVSSRATDGTKFSTQVHDYNGGVKLRVPLGGIEPSLTLGYGDQVFMVSGAGRPPLPNVEYKYLRAVLGLRVALPSNLSLIAGGGYRHVLSPGDIKTTFFPHLAVRGFEVNAGVGYAINSTIEARFGVDLRQYGYTMHSRNGEMYIVGGAVDRTTAFSLSLAVMLGGADQPRSGGASEETPPPAGDEDSRPTRRQKVKRATGEGDGATGME